MATLIESELETEALRALEIRLAMRKNIDEILKAARERSHERHGKAYQAMADDAGFQDLFGRTHFPKRAGA